METLASAGFEYDEWLAQELLKANPNLEPLLFRYYRMGTYHVISKGGDRYILTLLGGSNREARREKLDRYSSIMEGDLTLDQVIGLANIIE
jgi:hypothetical protein